MIKKLLLSKFLSEKTEKRRNLYKKRKQKRLQNPSPTIICNNCVSGAIYRDLNLQYASPTVNVLIHADDFFLFIQHLKEFLSCTPEELVLEGVSYPVGVLKHQDKQVVLRFMHDKDFQTAKEKWVKRCERVDFQNLYIIYHHNFQKQKLYLKNSYKRYKAFKELPFKNKRLVTNTWFSFDTEIVPLWKCFFFRRDSVLEYPTKHSKKRLMDQFDYVSFLNKK